ncbi:hypothetical protein TL16_g12160 [Triparma laevis f. inornata]|uniref:Phosphoribosyltransferase domain-containing protein n=1 Tax=Triparma laevis f. inornata TaxID=1714386 RepID=A0A9W7EU43_9STRA|nr:hypothetical protein TL16_g12160 [Triparma laevis f. inornata]
MAKKKPHRDGKCYFSYADIADAVSSKVTEVEEFAPDVIIAIGGGGFIPARMLRTEVNKPILAISLELYNDDTNTMRKEVMKNQWFSESHGLGSKVRGGRMLIVDEVDDSRTTLQYAVETLQRENAPAAIAVLVVHNKLKEKKGTLPKDIVYIAGDDVEDHWNAYPWDCKKYGNSIEKHEELARSCDVGRNNSLPIIQILPVLALVLLLAFSNFTMATALAPTQLPQKRVAVVGSGIGGLVTAGILSTYPSVHVTVMEKRESLGGRCESVTRTHENVTFRTETGPSLLLLPAVYEETFKLCGVDDMKEVGVDIRECEGATYGIFQQNQSDDLISLYIGGNSPPPPAMNDYMEVSNLMLEVGLPLFIENKFGYVLENPGKVLDLVKAIFKTRYNPFAPLSKTVEGLIDEKTLRPVATFQSLYVGLTPGEFKGGSVFGRACPSLFSLLSSLELLKHKGGRRLNGVYAPLGGFATITKGLQGVLEGRENVEFVLGRAVESVGEAEGGRVLVDGDIFDAAVVNVESPVAKETVLKGRGGGYYGWDEATMLSSSVLQFNFLVDRELARLRSHNIFLADNEKEEESWSALWAQDEQGLKHEGGEEFNFYVHHPRTTDASCVTSGHDILTVLVPYSHLRFDESKTKADEYEAISDVDVEKVRQIVLSRIRKAEGVNFEVLWEEQREPKGWAKEFSLPGGAVFGAAHGLGQLSVFRQRKEIDGCAGGYFVGASTSPGNGVPLVMIGARQVAEKVRRYLNT